MNSVKIQQAGDNASHSGSYWLLALFSFGAFLSLAGCTAESDRRPISGTVSVDGTPVVRGSISFFPDHGHSGPAASTSISAGKYRFTSVNGPSAGPHRVVVGVETNPPGLAITGASLSERSSSAKQAPSEISTNVNPTKEPIASRPSRTQWESKSDVSTGNSSAAYLTIDFALQSEIDLGNETSQDSQ